MKRNITTLLLYLACHLLSYSQGLGKAEADKELQTVIDQWFTTEKTRTDYITQRQGIVQDSLFMRISCSVYGETPADGHSLYISLHGGGNAPTQLNNSQWQNQWYLYRPAEGIYICPRAPYDDWDMHFKPATDAMYRDLINYAYTHLKVNPDKVYIMGYSAGGDGIWRLAPRMADTWAAASMMAGHPGDVSLLNLRNLPFMIWCGAKDGAYDRNKKCAERITELDSLHRSDPEGYIHEGHIVPGKPHWMDQVDTAAVEWMSQYRRNPYPKKIVWHQEEVLKKHFYWIGAPENELSRGKEVRLEVKGNNIYISHCDYTTLTLYLNDHIVDMDKSVTVYMGKKRITKQLVPRSRDVMVRTLHTRQDSRYAFFGELTIRKN